MLAGLRFSTTPSRRMGQGREGSVGRQGTGQAGRNSLARATLDVTDAAYDY